MRLLGEPLCSGEGTDTGWRDAREPQEGWPVPQARGRYNGGS
jgi:hypothetical protein